MQSSSCLTVDLGALYNNLKTLTSSFGQVMVMVKANAYGTDPVLISKFLQTHHLGGIPYIGVSHIGEGIHLREEGVILPIFVISTPPRESDLAAAYEFTSAVSSLQEIEVLNQAAKKYGKKIRVHLHLNTGMNRFGISPQEAFDFYRAIKKASNLLLEGIMTHFVAAESPAFDSFTESQIKQFKAFLDSLPTLPKWIHAANSGGAVRFNLPFCNLARIGLGFVGYGVCLEGSKPVLSLKTTLSSVSYSNKGENVGYNRTYTVTREKERIGVIPVGYHDGFPRSVSGKGYVLIQGKKAPMIGTICMDFMMIDLTEIPEARVGDEVILFGPGLSVETIAAWGETNVREVLVSLPARVKRIWANPPLYPNILRTENESNPERLSSSFFPFEKDPNSR